MINNNSLTTLVDDDKLLFEKFEKIVNRKTHTHAIPKKLQKPGHTYYLCVIDSPDIEKAFLSTGKTSLEHYLEVGYHFVYSDEPEINQSLDVPKDKPPTKKQPLLVKMRSGYTAVYLEIEDSILKDWFKRQSLEYKKHVLNSIGKKYIRGYEYIDGGMIDPKNDFS